MTLDQALIDIGRLCAADKAQCGVFAHKLQRLAPDLVAHMVARETGQKRGRSRSTDRRSDRARMHHFRQLVRNRRETSEEEGDKGSRARRYRADLKAWTIRVGVSTFAIRNSVLATKCSCYREDELPNKARRDMSDMGGRRRAGNRHGD